MSEIQQLEKAIAALEAQRGALGDSVVETMLAPAREKLAALQARPATDERRRKQITVLFADVSGFTALSESLDAEEVGEIMDALWARLDAAIVAAGGHIDKHTGDGVMALWGSESVREDDPERAIRAALAMEFSLTAFCDEHRLPLAIRIGLHTGPVLLGEIGSTHEFTAIGDTVNLASRLEHAAAAGAILISHDTYRHVRGVFDVQPQLPLVLKGKSEPVQTYVVQGAKPRAFRTVSRGIEGIETRMVGRDTEMRVLRGAFGDALRGRAHLALVVGEAGVGKSRLLSEFENWLDLRPEVIYLFKARAAAATQGVPFGLLRDLFANRFDILETDPVATALEKFRAGMAGGAQAEGREPILPPERADLVGQLVGFDFSLSPAVRNLAGSADFGKLALGGLAQYFRAMAERRPVVMLLEDLHWADDVSLDAVTRLLAALPDSCLLVVGMTRPALFERRRGWVEGDLAVTRLDLEPLSPGASRELVDEILQKMEIVPDALRDLVVNGAEGNPFYVEELVKMLLDRGVIQRCGPLGEAWCADLRRLEAVRIPSTLAGVLQARLDNLPRVERELLQRAAVVGRTFWAAAVAELTAMPRDAVGEALRALRDRELIYRRERSAIAETDEYQFKHVLLRDAAYDTVLLRVRKDDHARVAGWLESHAGERLAEHSGLIAEHLVLAGQPEAAARRLRVAAERALATGAIREAQEIGQRALSLLPEGSPDRPALQVLVGRTVPYVTDFTAARRHLEAALVAAEAAGDRRTCVQALGVLGRMEFEQGDYADAKPHLERSLSLAREVDDARGAAYALFCLAWVNLREGAYREGELKAAESRAIAESIGYGVGMALATNALAALALSGFSDYSRAMGLYEEALRLFRESGARSSEAIVLNNMAEAARDRGDYAQAQQYSRQAGALSAELGDQLSALYTGVTLGHITAAMGDDAEARARYLETLRLARDARMVPLMLDILAGLAAVQARAGEADAALEVLGMVSGHPALMKETRLLVDKAVAALRERQSDAEIQAGLARGKILVLEDVVARTLAAHDTLPH